MRRIRKYIVLCLLTLAALPAAAQHVGIKTNLLYDATATPNLGMEVGLGPKNSVQLVYGINAWTYRHNKKMQHWSLMPEYRRWFCQRFNGHFIGVHLMGGQFNAGGLDLPIKRYGDIHLSELKTHRYQGWYAGGGITYGYQWMLSRHWNLEGSIGVGYDYISYKKYPCLTCGALKKKDHKNYVGPTKLALSLIYVF